MIVIINYIYIHRCTDTLMYIGRGVVCRVSNKFNLCQTEHSDGGRG